MEKLVAVEVGVEDTRVDDVEEVAAVVDVVGGEEVPVSETCELDVAYELTVVADEAVRESVTVVVP